MLLVIVSQCPGIIAYGPSHEGGNNTLKRQQFRALSLALAVALTVTLSACSKSTSQPKTDSGTTPAAQKVTITVENAPRQDDKVNYQLFLDEIARFNKVYPNIEVKPDSYQWDPSTFAARLQGGTAGDLWLVPYTEIQGLIAKKAVGDITDLMNQAKDPAVGDWQDGVLKVVKGQDSKIYGIPVGGYSIGLIYNKVLFQQAGLDPNKPPKTWDELAQYAQKLTDRSKNQAGLALFAKGNQGGWQFLNFAWQGGGDYIKQNGSKWQATLDTPEVVKALQFYKDLRWKYDVLTPNVMLTAGDVFPLMASHQAAMFLGAPEWLDIIGGQQGGKVDEFMVASLPAGPAGAFSQMGGSIRVVNPKSSADKQKAAVTFAL